MRTLTIVLLLAAAVPATAQQPVITDFGTNGMVTWTNPDTNTFFAIDVTWNLNYNWIQMSSTARAKRTVMHTSRWDVGDYGFMIDLEGMFTNMRSFAESMGDRTDALFVRVRISPDCLRSGTVTNWLRVCNASTSVLQNLTFGIESSIGNRWDNYPVDDLSLPPQSNTTFHAMSYTWPIDCVGFGIGDDAARYFIAYTQAGRTHDFVTDALLPVGPPRKEITFTVSNESFTVNCGWLPIGRTTEY